MATTTRIEIEDPILRGHIENDLERLADEFRGTFSPETIER